MSRVADRTDTDDGGSADTGQESGTGRLLRILYCHRVSPLVGDSLSALSPVGVDETPLTIPRVSS